MPTSARHVKAARDAGAAEQVGLGLRKGDPVEVRDNDDKPWVSGAVSRIRDDGRPLVRRDACNDPYAGYPFRDLRLQVRSSRRRNFLHMP